ncbi:Tautomerase/MIF superfamily [Schizophyllum fasciatum]
MPILDLTTNVKPADQRAFIVELTKKAADVLDRPVEYVQVNVNFNEHLCFGGTFDPSVQLNLTAVDRLGVTQNQTIGGKLKPFFEEKLGVPANRCYIIYYDPGMIFQ